MKKILQKIYSGALSHRIRMMLGWRVPMSMRPFSNIETVSDLFPWRADDKWETLYALPNMISQFYPDRNESDTVSLVIYDADGGILKQHKMTLKPMEVSLIQIKDYLEGLTGYGTFALFHDVRTVDEFKLERTHGTERGYFAFKWAEDDIWSYVHGNLKAVSKHPDKPSVHGIIGHQNKDEFYRPQLLFNDCDRFELAYTNPSKKAQKITVLFKDKAHKTIEEKIETIPPFGIKIIECDNVNRNIAIVEGWGKLSMWRPLIFKYYQTHFDVFHS